MIIVAATSTLLFAMIKNVLDDILLKKDQEMLIWVPASIIVISIIKAIASYFQNYSIKFIGQKVVVDMQMQLYEHLIYSDIGFLSKFPSGKLLSRFTNDMTLVRIAVSDFLTGMAREIFTVIFLIILMFYQNATLALLVFTVFPLTIFPLIKIGKKIRKISYNTQEELENYTAKLDDSFSNIRLIKAYLQEKFEIQRAKKIVDEILKLYLKSIRADSITSPLTDMLSGIAIALVIIYGGAKVIDGTVTPGNIVTFLAAFIAAYRPLKNLAELNNNLQEGLAVAERFFQIIDVAPQITDSPNAIILQKTDQASISCRNLHFSYGAGDVLKNVNFQVETGQMVSFVGSSGSGKSTIVNLLLHFFDFSKGEILINDHKIQDIQIASLRQFIGIVTQESMMLDDTIFANIAYGNPNATKEEVIKAAEIACAHEFIMEIPGGYQANAGQGGMRLSGGQRQRISIARAILKNPEILILDEATSALDSVTEMKIHEFIKDFRKNRTTIIIAHRISTIKNSDLINVMSYGEIIESGTHEILIKLPNSTYSDLYKASIRS